MEEQDFADTLRAYRNEHGLSPKQMADILALSETDYVRMENGTMVPEPEDERKYRNALIQARP
jgi:DNA-binding XRE family transcriptional regulator